MEELRICYINWMHFVSSINTWTVFMLYSSTESAEKFLQIVEMCLTMCKEQSPFTKETGGVDKMPSTAKKRFLRKKFKQQFISALEKNKSTQTIGSVFAERIEKPKRLNLKWNQ